MASLGIRQSPRGDSDNPIFGPSGRQERLNCWLKKRRQNVVSHFLMVALSNSPSKAICASAKSSSERIRDGANCKGRSRAVRMDRRCLQSFALYCHFVGWNQFRADRGVDDVEQCGFAVSSSRRLAIHATRCFTSVLGTLALTPYIDMWSPL